jgi:hypothetical protein
VAYVFRTEGWDALLIDIVSHAVWVAILAGAVGLVCGTVAAARR